MFSQDLYQSIYDDCLDSNLESVYMFFLLNAYPPFPRIQQDRMASCTAKRICALESSCCCICQLQKKIEKEEWEQRSLRADYRFTFAIFCFVFLFPRLKLEITIFSREVIQKGWLFRQAEPLLQGRCARSEEMRPLGDFLQDTKMAPRVVK